MKTLTPKKTPKETTTILPKTLQDLQRNIQKTSYCYPAVTDSWASQLLNSATFAEFVSFKQKEYPPVYLSQEESAVGKNTKC